MSRVRPGLVILLFAVLSILPHLPAVEGEFLLDDHSLIENNVRIQSWTNVADWFTRGFWNLSTEGSSHGQQLTYYRPWVVVSYAWDWWWGGGSPIAFHVTNLVLAALCSALILLTTWRWFEGNWIAALLAGGVFAFHPSKPETISWISGRPDLLLSIGCLLVLWGVARFAQRERGAVGLQVLGVLLAYGSKEHAVILPLLVGAEVLFLSQRHPSLFNQRQAMVLVCAQLFLVAFYLAAREMWYPLHSIDTHSLSFSYRVALVLESLGRYFELLVWPWDMGVFRADVPLQGSEYPFFSGYRLWGCVVCILSVLGAIWSWKKNRRVFWFLLLFFGLLLPVLNIRPMGAVSLICPRFLFLPLLAWGCLLAACAGACARLFQIGLGLWVILGVGLTTVRAADFQTESRFWTVELRSNPEQFHVVWSKARQDALDGEPLLGVARLRCLYQKTLQSPEILDTSDALRLAVALTDQATPDSEAAQLRELATWLSLVLDNRPASAQLLGVPWHFSASVGERDAIQQRRGSLSILLAQLLSRLEDPQSEAWVEQALEVCSGCVEILEAAAVLAIREGHYEEGLRRHKQAGDRRIKRAGFERMEDYITAVNLWEERAKEAPAGSLLQVLAQVERDILIQHWGRAARLLRKHPELLEVGSLDDQVRYLGSLVKSGYVSEARDKLYALLTEEEFGLVWQTLQTHFVVPPYQEPPAFVEGVCALPEELK